MSSLDEAIAALRGRKRRDAVNIEEGKKYVDRQGVVHGPIERSVAPNGMPDSETWVWREVDREGGGWNHWTRDGYWYQNGKESPRDLVDEWVDLAELEKMDQMFGRTEANRAQGPLLSDGPMTKHRLLDLAKEATADRGLNYGKPEDNFERIARRWNVHLINCGYITPESAAGMPFGGPITPVDVALMCADLKTARLENTPDHKDSWVDLAGYAACGAEIALAPAAQPLRIKMPQDWNVSDVSKPGKGIL